MAENTPPPESDASTAADSLTEAVVVARRGFRSDVAVLVDALATGRLFLPLAKRVSGIELGVEVEVGEELNLSPHLIADEQSLLYLPVFTRAEWVEALGVQLSWQTEGAPLEYCALPGEVMLEVALSVVDAERVMGLLIDPMQASELMLQRHEIASLAQNRPVPLVGYVSHIARYPGEKPLISELEEPISQEVTAAIEGVLQSVEPRPEFFLRQTFNAERDLEPHLTLNLVGVGTGTDRAHLAERLGESLEGRLPPPGYIDILFEDPFVR